MTKAKKLIDAYFSECASDVYSRMPGYEGLFKWLSAMQDKHFDKIFGKGDQT